MPMPIEDARRDQERKRLAAALERDKRQAERPAAVTGRDYWRAGQREDAMAGDEGIDDPPQPVTDTR